MAEVFLSYSHHDKQRAATLRRIIEKRRTVFMDRRRLVAGAQWQPALRQALADARCIVVLWSENSIRSEWVQREAREGLARNVLVPARIDDVPIPEEFADRHAADLVGWRGESNEDLKGLITRIDEVLRLPPGTPDVITDEWTSLVEALDVDVPPKAPGHNLLVATWNVRELGGLTETWTSRPEDSPKRDRRAALAIAEIVSRFDIVLLSEVVGSMEALRAVLGFLGDEWSFLLTGQSTHPAGNAERHAFVFDTRRVLPAGLVDQVIPEYEPARSCSMLVNPLYVAGFRTRSPALPVDLVCAMLHLDYGLDDAATPGDVGALRTWLEGWAADVRAAGQALLVLGDFYADRHRHPLYHGVASRLTVPDSLRDVPRSIFAGNDAAKFQDQVAWFGDSAGGPGAGLHHCESGWFDFVGAVHAELQAGALSHRISDHYPAWTEFTLPKAI